MGASRKAPEIKLTDEERRILIGYTRRHTTAQALATMRAGVGVSVDGDCLAALERALAATGAI